MKGQTYVILAILCTIIISIFAVLNMSVVEVNYLFWNGSSPLIFVILFSVLSGSVLTMLFGMRKFIQLRRINRQMAEQIRSLEADISSEEELTDTAAHVKDRKVHPQKEKNDD